MKNINQGSGQTKARSFIPTGHKFRLHPKGHKSRQAAQLSLNQSGFTLIEIMVVVVILSILAAFVVPKIMDRPDQARAVKAEQDIRAIEGALKLYKLDSYFYPSTDQSLMALVKRPQDNPEPKNWKEGGYLDRLPVDPWGNEYLYLNPGVHGPIDIFSMGADGQPGGEGINADIGNWRDDK